MFRFKISKKLFMLLEDDKDKGGAIKDVMKCISQGQTQGYEIGEEDTAGEEEETCGAPLRIHTHFIEVFSRPK